VQIIALGQILVPMTQCAVEAFSVLIVQFGIESRSFQLTQCVVDQHRSG